MYGTRTVSDVVPHTVAAAGPRAFFEETVQLMQDRQVSALPVIEGEGRAVGVVSEADLPSGRELRDSPQQGHTRPRGPAGTARPKAFRAAGLTPSPAGTVHANATLAEAARTMACQGVKRLPVVDGTGLPRGPVSRADVLKVFPRGDDDLAGEVRRTIVPRLFPPPARAVQVQVQVHDAIATPTGRVRDTALIPVAARPARAVEGVVDVQSDLARNHHAPSRTGRPRPAPHPPTHQPPAQPTAGPPGNERSP